MTSKHPMSSKQWLWAFLGTVLLLTILVMGFNFWSDPSAPLAIVFSNGGAMTKP